MVVELKRKSSIDEVLRPCEFDAQTPISQYASHITELFAKVARNKRIDLEGKKHKSGAVYTGNPDSPSGYQRVVISDCPDWYRALYWQHNYFETHVGKKGQPKKMILGPVRRLRTLRALVAIEIQKDGPTNLQSIVREHIFDELVDPDKANDFVMQDYFGTRIEDPHSQVPIEAYELIDRYL